MHLYSFRKSPNPLKVRLALSELGLSYDTTEINLFQGEQRRAEFLKVNPFGKVPVFEDQDLRLIESDAILAYLGRKYGTEALWPVNNIAKEGLALQWLFFESNHLFPSCGKLWWADLVAPKLGRPATSDQILNECVEALTASLNLLNKPLENHPYLLGEHFSLTDCSLGVTLSMLQNTRFSLQKQFPAIASYVARIQDRESWHKENGKDIL